MASKKKKKAPVDLEFTLRRVFGKHSFRPMQREVIIAALNRQDIFLQAATSFGKSLCFQLPAVIDHGITIVVSPLLALMTNQVAALRSAGVEAASINSTTSYPERQRILRDLECGHPKTRLLYVTPEQCQTETFRRRLEVVHEQMELSRIAIDEAHCISEWGHDFRPSFKSLFWFRETFPDVPIMCLTATATSKVRNDIIATLRLSSDNLKLVTMTTSRPNLHYEVRYTSDSKNRFENFYKWLCGVHSRRRDRDGRNEQLETEGQRLDGVSGIIYTLFRRDCESIALELCARGIGAKPFHAGLSTFEKDETLRGWINDAVGYDIIVATTAFGMGIDKENVRFVVHWQIPKSFEGFYQEAGRAGRDGKAAMICVYYSREDRDRITYLIGKAKKKDNAAEIEARAKSFQALVSYCESTNLCRHVSICRYFGENIVPQCYYACDFHKDPEALVKAKEEGLASEEWCSTQQVNVAEEDEYD